MNNVRVTIDEVRQLTALYLADDIRMYDMKKLVGDLLLLPAMCFQLRGRRVDKRTAIEEASGVFSPQGVTAVRQAESVRSNWARVCTTSRFRIFQLSPFVFRDPHLYRRFAQACSPRLPGHLLPRIDGPLVDRLLDDATEHLGSQGWEGV
jgi:hypothetical protein